MKIKREDLLTALEAVRPAATLQQQEQILGKKASFLFTEENIVCDNGIICISYPFKTDFKCLVPWEEFYKATTLIRSNFLMLNYNEKKSKLFVKSKENRLAINTLNEDRSVMLDSIDLKNAMKQMKLVPRDFIDGLKQCLFTISKERGEAQLQNIFIIKNAISSTDKFRISKYLMRKSFSDNFTLPDYAAANLINFDVKKYYSNGSIMLFMTDADILFCSVLANDKYPINDKGHFDFEGDKITFPPEIINMVNLSSIFADGDKESEKRVIVKIAEGKIFVKGENKSGRVENSQKLTSKLRKEINFYINPVYFIEAIEKIHDAKVGSDRILFSSDNFKHLIALYVE